MESLDLDGAEGIPSERRPCGLCKARLNDEYFMAKNMPLCTACRQSSFGGGGSLLCFVRAIGLGFIGAVLGALLDVLITRVTGLQLGLIAIVMGWLVGLGVSVGARDRGGCLYQILALGLTYFAISFSLVGQITSAALNGEIALDAPTAISSPATAKPVPTSSPRHTPFADGLPNVPGEQRADLTATDVLAALLATLAIGAALPVMVAMEAPSSALIFGFALYQAASMNRKVTIIGPFHTKSLVDREESPRPDE